MAADQRLERVKIARLRRRDKEPITGLDYHRAAAVTRNTASAYPVGSGCRLISHARAAGALDLALLGVGEGLAAQAGEELRFLESRPMGGAWVLDDLWRRLGVGAALARAPARRRVTPAVERLIFALVANRALDPMSKLAALEWAQLDTWLPGVGGLGSDPQVFYRAMDFLLDCDEEVQRECSSPSPTCSTSRST